MENRIDSSRRKTPWDNDDNHTAIQKFILNEYKNDFYIKHPKLSETSEANIINSIQITNCRYCGSENIRKNGFTQNGIQRYNCKDCNKKFSPTTGTIFENHKISITEWILFLLELFNYSSTSLISKVNKNSMNTSTYWLQKSIFSFKKLSR